jgi:uncharacterized protein YggE
MIFKIVGCTAVFAILLSLSAHATEKAVTVSGEGRISAAPDTALIRLGVTTQAETARQASDANAQKMNALLETLKKNGIPARDIQTSRLSLQPQYETNKSDAVRLLGFKVTNQVTVKIHNIGNLPAILDRGIGAGANEIAGIEFVVSEQSKILDKAREEAIADAHRKASLYAHAAGGKLGHVLSIAEGTSTPSPQPFATLRQRAVPIAPGEQILSATVSVSYELTQ